MNWRKTSVDGRSESPSSFRRRTSEPRDEDNRHCHSHWFSSSSLEGPVTNGHAGGSTVRNHCNGTARLYENKDEHFRKLSQFCENLQMESSSKKFGWENLFAQIPAANANSKSSLGLKNVHGCDDGDNRGIRASGSHLGTGSSSKDNLLQGNKLCTFHMNNGGTKDSNVKIGNVSRSFGIDDCGHMSSSRNFDGLVYGTSDVVRVQDRPVFQLGGNSHSERRNGSSSHEEQASHLHSSARFTESKGIWQEYEGHLPLTSTDYSTWKKEKHREQVETQLNMEELMEYKRTKTNHVEQFKDCNQYFEVQPHKRSEIGAAALNSPFSQHMVRIPQDDFYQDSMRTSVVMDPFVEGFEDTESYVVNDMEETPPRDDYDYFNEVLGSGTGSSMKGEREAYISREKLVLAEENGYRTNYGKWKHEEDGLNGSLVSKHEQCLSDMEDNRKLRWSSAHSTKSMAKGRRCGVHYHHGSDSSRKPNVFSRIQFPSHGGDKDNEINLNTSNKKRWNNEDIASTSLTSAKRPLPWAINQGSPRPKSKRRDIKKRLGITFRDSSSNPNPQVIEPERNTNKRLREANVIHDKCLDVQASDCFEEKIQSSSSGPKAEDPTGLKVDSAFFKFVKVLSENPARRKKFIEPGCGIIKCIVCGSKSKEFKDSLSLSEHAFLSLEGSRAEHLGLHKALCWLMGWSSEASANSLWVRRDLPLMEVLALKDDLIIWPPVLIIHNSSISIDNTSEQVTMSISCEELEVFIRGMGCGGGKFKVGRGKPGNHSIMVATFSATFPGLQEAERLHKSFADKSRGRDEFLKTNSSHLIDSHKDLDKVMRESLLYGYLGLAEDLDKLDFETKKRCVVKSKKEIQAIVNASCFTN